MMNETYLVFDGKIMVGFDITGVVVTVDDPNADAKTIECLREAVLAAILERIDDTATKVH